MIVSTEYDIFQQGTANSTENDRIHRVSCENDNSKERMKIENMKFKLRLKQAKIRNMDIAECLKVNKNTVTKMVEEPGRYITLDEAFQIRDHYFPEMTIDVLFGEEQKVTGDADETVKMLLNKALNILQKK